MQHQNVASTHSALCLGSAQTNHDFRKQGFTRQVTNLLIVQSSCREENNAGEIRTKTGSRGKVFAAVGEFPWVVSVQDLHHNHLAFGAILSEHWILSAASSFQTRHQALAVVGITDLNMQRKPQPQYSISTIIPHEDFNEITLDKNIALMKMVTPVKFSDTVQPICFPSRNITASALENCWVSGWLHPTAGGSTAASFLRKLSVVDVDPCPLKRIVTTECSSHRESDNVTGCLGDPGNPVMCQVKGTEKWVLNGVLSQGGMRCYGPFLYTKVAYYSDWISATTAEAGVPIYPTLAQGRSTFQALTEDLDSSFQLAERGFQSSVTSEGGSEHHQAKPREKDMKSPQEGLARANTKSDPVYYDYYSGETLPISMGSLRQPQIPREMLVLLLLLCLPFY
ncbi:LOW QUALITY PROTEIN: inactive serine protease 54 [Emydura macquarii macquarii]|uniref:LOW QUALITY PROTEIN: inactive serine protease 54 n=1 Tax=Emydura macquarii macquarii TaxID=1129001 RepID=UPI00352B03EA